MAKPFDRFGTIAAAKANAQRLLRKYEDSPGEPIADAQDVADIEAMIRNHPNSLGIVGTGVKHHCVMPDDRGSRGFRTVRTDGTIDPWSYQTAINGRYRSDKDRALAALRWEVRDFIEGQRRVWLKGDGALIDETDVRQAHHGKPWPFKRIVHRFLDDQLLYIEEIEVEHPVADGRELVGALQLKDRTMAVAWCEFHNSRARIKFINTAVHERITIKNTLARRDLDDDEDFEGVTE